MQRREFLKVALAAPLGVLVPGAARPEVVAEVPPFVHPYLGKYLGHVATRNTEPYEVGGKTYYSWPVVTKLAASFEQGSVGWFSFAASTDLVHRINGMSPRDLFRDVNWEGHDNDAFNFVLPDSARLTATNEASGALRNLRRGRRFASAKFNISYIEFVTRRQG